MKRIDYLRSEVERLRTHPTDECVEWPYSRNATNYGRVPDGKTKYVHRVAFEIFYHKKPGKWVLHNCNNPACFNPAHLREGSPKDNSSDAIKVGSNHRMGRFSLTPEDARAIIRLLNDHKLKQCEIAKRFNVTDTAISYIKNGYTWRHLPRLQRPTLIEHLLDGFHEAARDIGYLAACGDIHGNAYQAADTRLQDLRKELLKMYDEHRCCEEVD